MRILVKFPTRERPIRFDKAVHAMIDMQAVRPGWEGEHTSEYLFAIDDDDRSMYQVLPSIRCSKGPRVSKIEAVNRGLPGDYAWDIVVLASDDMLCQVQGWDDIIRKDMVEHFPDTDGCLWYPDGHQNNLCTLPVMGRKYFDRFGYIYHPSYKSLWADNEQHEVADSLGKMRYCNQQLFTHMHPGWGTAKMDRLYQSNNKFEKQDRENFQRRQALGFPV